MSSSRRSSIISRPSRSPRSRSSSVDSNNSGLSSQNSYSTELHGPEVFAISTNSNKSSKHPVTVALTKDAKGSPFVMRILLDPCCTGTGLISARVADSLGLDIRPATHRGTFTSVGGKFNTIGYVTVPSIVLPVLSQDKTVTLELEMVPDKAHMTYGIIMGQDAIHDLQIDTKISTHEIIWEDTHRPMVSRKYWSNKRTKQIIPVLNRILKRSDAKQNSVGDVSTDSGHSAYTSQPEPSITNDANASFTQPITEDSVHSSTILADEHSIIGSNISFGIESPNTPTHINIGQVFAAPEYKQEVYSQPIITELTQYAWELVTSERVKQHITNNIKEIITNAQLRSGNCNLIIRDNSAWDLGIFRH